MVKYKGGISCEKIARFRNMDSKHFNVYIPINADNTVLSAAELFKSAISKTLAKNAVISSSLELEKINQGFVFSTFSCVKSKKAESLSKKVKGEDFAVYKESGAVYVLSHLSRGVYYGVCELIERNLPVVFSRGAKEESLQYLKVDACDFTDTDFICNCDFSVRSFNLCGLGSDGVGHIDYGTAENLARNKCNSFFHSIDDEWRNFGVFHNGKRVRSLQVFDDLMTEHPEYFMTGIDGKPKSAFGGYESFPNYFNKDLPKVLAQRVVKDMGELKGEDILHWTMPDNSCFFVMGNGVKLHEQPFTCDDGTVVYPSQANYKSTVYFNFVNRLIKEINKLRPGTSLQVFSYIYTELVPAIDIDKRLKILYAPIFTNEKYPYTDLTDSSNAGIRKNLEEWSKKTDELYVYAYWQTFSGSTYTRPILKTVKENLKWFRTIGVKGITVEMVTDCSFIENLSDSQKNQIQFFDMNEAYVWAVSKLMWNPDLDVDELLRRYTKVVYKECAQEIFEYFKLIESGWDKTPATVWYTTGGDVYYLQMVVGAGIDDKVLSVLATATKKATTPSVIRKVNSIYKVVSVEIEKYKNFVAENAEVSYFDGDGRTLLTKTEMDYENNPESFWNNVKPLTVLRNARTLQFYPEETKFSLRIVYDKENLYFGYTLHDRELSQVKVTDSGRKLYYRENGKQIVALSETYIGGDVVNQSVYYGYTSGFTDANKNEQGDFYVNNGEIKSIKIPDGVYTKNFARLDKDKDKRYLFHVQVIPFAVLGESVDTAKPYGSFAYVSDKFGVAGWQGFGLWSKQNFKEFTLVNSTEANKCKS
ncbi:MAG: DUF4838 domain-containing protein [Clostridiales bacterium]|nr:DUF4838 domain-containing protein [Clostridiales bacterium]MBE5754786.1 DUF4838 domain-containing protein [Clostridiales bacterium]